MTQNVGVRHMYIFELDANEGKSSCGIKRKKITNEAVCFLLALITQENYMEEAIDNYSEEQREIEREEKEEKKKSENVQKKLTL